MPFVRVVIVGNKQKNLDFYSSVSDLSMVTTMNTNKTIKFRNNITCTENEKKKMLIETIS